MYQMKCPAGTYTEDSFLKLVFVVVKHRLKHFFEGEGYRD